MPAPTIQFKRGLLANLPGLRAGEPGFTTDFSELYIGLNSTTDGNKFFGSHRYWTRGTASTGSGVNFVEGTSSGTDYITIKAPNTLAGIVTFTLPLTDGGLGDVLRTSGSGALSFVAPTFTISNGIGSTDTVGVGLGQTLTFAGTANEIETEVTDNQVQIGLPGAVSITTSLVVGSGVTINISGINASAGIITALSFVGTALSISGISTFTNGPVLIGGGTSTGTAGQVLQVTGINSSVYIGGSVGLGTTSFSGVKLYVEGDAFFSGILTANRIISGQYGEFTGGNISGTSLVGTALSISGISTFTNGPVLIGGGTSTGTAGQVLQVTGINSSVYIGGSVGLGTTNPTSKLSVDGNVFVTGDLKVNGGDVTSDTPTLNLFNETVTNANVLGDASTIGIGSTSATLTLRPSTVVGANATQNLYNTVATTVNAFGEATALVIGATTGITTVRNDLTVGGDLRINGNDIQASDGNTNITLTSNTLTAFAGDIRVNGNDIQASDGNANITLTSNTLTTFAGDIKVGGNDIQASDGTTAITLSTVTGNVGVSSNLTVSGDLFVNGTTTQINTNSLTVEDRTIDLGIVSGAAPGAATTWDLGILFNYYATTAKKSAVIWEHADSRFKFASVLAADTEGSDTSTPQLTVTTFAPIEIASLFVNDCAGATQVISCTGTERFLENITVDAGTF